MKENFQRKCHQLVIVMAAGFVALLLVIGNITPPTCNQVGGDDFSSSQPMSPRDSAPDEPIYIVGDAGWAAAKATGNCTGEGTLANPYVISGMVIDAGGPTSGIWIENTTVPFRIQDCHVSGATGFSNAGIRLMNASNAVLMGNNCTTNEWAGLVVTGQSANVTISANNVSANTFGSIGILVYDGCVNVTIEGNDVGFNGDGIIVNSHCNGTIVRANKIHENSFNGAWVDFDCNNASVEGNNITGNGEEGIQVSGCDKVTVRGNNCTGSGWHGIYLVGGDNCTVTNNLATGNARHGIYVAGGSRNATVVGNNASANAWRGITLYAGSNGSLVWNNSLEGNAGGNAQDDSNFSRWDNGARGNLWANYTGTDPDDDGIGNAEFPIPGLASAIDHYPIWDDGDDIAPLLYSTGFVDDQLCGPAAPAFTLGIYDVSPISGVWVTYDGGYHNWTCGISGTLPQWTSLPNGTVVATFWANDTAGNEAIGIVAILRRDALAPLLDVKLVKPACEVECDVPSFTVNATDAQLDLTWYTIGTNPTRHFFTGAAVTIDAVAWAACPAGEVTITFHANDTLGNEQMESKTFTKQEISGNGGDLGWYAVIGGGITLAVVAGTIIIQKKRKRSDNTL